ncbi:hypothetical protein [Clostridium sporogenes]|uniref:ORC-CDC6 family AAA ATPase n=1 Tax=Clostridium sporogenes TaxID=1509 RepID=UPI0013D8DA03|nr:hypothetical protein [Clostridium sporogenes]NFP90180.1 hypothetical protein [Clostridium sporogenes]
MVGNNELIIRADDIKDEELYKLYVGSEADERILQYLINRTPTLLVGSRGCGKTMLLKVAEKRMEDDFNESRILPVFITFKEAALIEHKFFKQWMISKILFALKRKLKKMCNILNKTKVFEEFFDLQLEKKGVSEKLDKFKTLLEESWITTDINLDNEIKYVFNDINSVHILNEVDYFNALMEDVCDEFNISRIVFLFDEACHNFIPVQQRTFFTLFRDIRSSYVNCKAAVYPGISSYGYTFQKFHDATEVKIERSISDKDYIINMREMIRKQVDERAYNRLEKNGELLDMLIYASSGNPRILLKSLGKATDNLSSKLKNQETINTIKEFYRIDIWNEHLLLRDKYKGHKKLIDWGREFIENKVLQDIHDKNLNNKEKALQTIYFSVERDSPEWVKKCIRILEHSGIVSIHKEGIKKVMSQKSKIFDRYQINLGVILANEKNPNILLRCNEITKNITVDLGPYYSMNSPSFLGMDNKDVVEVGDSFKNILKEILEKSVDELDITQFQKDTIKQARFYTLGDILKGSEKKLQQAYGIGEIKSRRIFNITLNAAIEYISG